MNARAEISTTTIPHQVPELLTVEDVAGILRCSRRKVYDLVERGELQLAYKLFHGSRKGWRWSASDIMGYLNECQARAREEVNREMDAISRLQRHAPAVPPAFNADRLRRKSA